MESQSQQISSQYQQQEKAAEQMIRWSVGKELKECVNGARNVMVKLGRTFERKEDLVEAMENMFGSEKIKGFCFSLREPYLFCKLHKALKRDFDVTELGYEGIFAWKYKGRLDNYKPFNDMHFHLSEEEEEGGVTYNRTKSRYKNTLGDYEVIEKKLCETIGECFRKEKETIGWDSLMDFVREQKEFNKTVSGQLNDLIASFEVFSSNWKKVYGHKYLSKEKGSVEK